MGQNHLDKSNYHPSQPLNWQPLSNDTNTLVNKLTHQQIQKNHIKIPMKKLSKQVMQLSLRLNYVYPYTCRLYYYHYSSQVNSDAPNYDKDNRTFCVYTDKMIKLQTQNWSRQNILHALQGFQHLVHIYGPFKITEGMIGQNQHGQIRVWINPNPGQTHPSNLCSNQQQSISLLAGLLAHKNKALASIIIGCSTYREASQKLQNIYYDRSLSFYEITHAPTQNRNRKHQNQIKPPKHQNHRNVFGPGDRFNYQDQSLSTYFINSKQKNLQNIESNFKLLNHQPNSTDLYQNRSRTPSYITVQAYQEPTNKTQKSKIDVTKTPPTIQQHSYNYRQKSKIQHNCSQQLQNRKHCKSKMEVLKHSYIQNKPDGIAPTFNKSYASKDHSFHINTLNHFTELTQSISMNKTKLAKQQKENIQISNNPSTQNQNAIFSFKKTPSRLGSYQYPIDHPQKQKNDKIPLFIKQKSKQTKHQQDYLLSKTSNRILCRNTHANNNHPQNNHQKVTPNSLNQSGLSAFTNLDKILLRRQCDSKENQQKSTIKKQSRQTYLNHADIIRNRMSEGPVDFYKPRIFSNCNNIIPNKSHNYKVQAATVLKNNKIDYAFSSSSKQPFKLQCQSVYSMQNPKKTKDLIASNKKEDSFSKIPQFSHQIYTNMLSMQDQAHCDISQYIPTTKSIQITRRSPRQSENTPHQSKKTSSHIKQELKKQFVSLFGQLKQKKPEKQLGKTSQSSDQESNQADLTQSQQVLKKKIKMKKMAFAELKKQALLVLTRQ